MRITLYLLRETAKLAKETLRKHHLYRERALRPAKDEGIEWRFFVRTGVDKPVRWLDSVKPLFAPVEDEEPPIVSKTAGGVLLVRAHEQLFGITFGTGFHAMNSTLIEPDFGIKVAANCVDPEKITLADARGLGKGRRNATSRLPVPNEMFALGLLTDEEWIRKFGGEVNITGFAKNASGADALQLNIENFDLFDLGPKLRQVLSLFESTNYHNFFPFLDYFRRETNKDLIDQLDAQIAENMRSRDPEIGFALPDEFNLTADIYRLSRYKRDTFLAELRTEDVYNTIDQLEGWKNPLQSVKIEAFDLSDQLLSERESLRSYVVGTVPWRGNDNIRAYTMTAGTWFRIDQEYVDLVDRYLRDNVTDLTQTVELLEWDDEYLKEHVEGRYGEERYNRWVSQQLGYSLLDRDLYRKRGGQQVEICDLLTRDKQLICVKRMDGSDKMSHLFQQGSVSTRMMMVNDDYRAKLMEKFRELDPAGEFGGPTEWTVVFAIATSKPGALKDIMYFFSRAALKTHGEAIKSCGFKVALRKIDKIPR